MKGEGMDALAAALLEIADHGFRENKRWLYGPRDEVEAADLILARLAEQGYVLVNVEGLAAALRATTDWVDLARGAEGRGPLSAGFAADWAAAIFATLRAE